LMLRKPFGASCIGIQPLENLSADSAEGSLAQLEPSWFREPILVEPLLTLQSSPSTLGFISEDGTARVVLSGIQLFATSAYCWFSPPEYSDDIVSTMEDRFLRYAKAVAKKGALGWLDIDWGITPSGEVIGIESNYRMTGWTAVAQLFRTLFGSDFRKYPALFSSDVLPLKASTTLSELADELSERGLEFDVQHRRGVFVSSCPSSRFFGIVAVSPEASDLRKMLCDLKHLSPALEEIPPNESV